MSPQLEIFNINNSSAMIAQHGQQQRVDIVLPLRANSIMQPCMIGVGAQVKW